jgi:hypothetical protein
MHNEMKFVDEGTATHQRLDMRTELQREYQKRPKRFVHSVFKDNKPWPTSTNIWCHHCCHPFTTMPLPLISRYDYERKICIGYGIFCSANCGRAYAREHKPLSWARSMIEYSLVLYESFGIPPSESSRPAWPKEMLINFGGTKTIEQFRDKAQIPRVMRVETVSFAMQNTTIVEICQDQFDGVTVGGLAPDTSEKDLLSALSAKVIDRHRGKAETTKFDGHMSDDDDDGEHDDIEVSLPKTKVKMQSAGQNPGKEQLSISVLESFMANLKAFGGDIEQTKAAMLSPGAIIPSSSSSSSSSSAS